MGLFDSVVHTITHPGDTLKGIKKNPIGSLTNQVGESTDPFGIGKSIGVNVGDPLNLLTPKSGPGAPGINPDVNNLKKQQQAYAQQFRSSIPQLQGQMVGQLRRDTQGQLNNNLSGLRSSNSSRGLLYGGVNQGQENQVRGAAQRGLIGGVSQINMGLQNEANQLDNSAIQTGVNIQQQQQSMQNMIYQNAMAQQAGQNQMMGSLISAGAMAALL